MIQEKIGKRFLIFITLVPVLSWGSIWGSEELIRVDSKIINAICRAREENSLVTPIKILKMIAHAGKGLILGGGIIATVSTIKSKKSFTPLSALGIGTVGCGILYERFLCPRFKKNAENLDHRTYKQKSSILSYMFLHLYHKYRIRPVKNRHKECSTFSDEPVNLNLIAYLCELKKEMKKIYHYQDFTYRSLKDRWFEHEAIRRRHSDTDDEFFRENDTVNDSTNIIDYADILIQKLKDINQGSKNYQDQLKNLRSVTRKKIEQIKAERLRLD